MSKRYTGNIISATPQIPENNYQDTPASGVWGMYEVEDLIKRGLWPTLGNLAPDKFIENIFKTYVYTGDSSTDRDIVNGLDLSNEGGLIWFKTRSNTGDHILFDTERGGTKRISTNSSNDETTSDWVDFLSNGFNIKASVTQINYNNYDYVNWGFRKAPKFFDVVTYTGDGVAGRTVSHNLGSVPGCIMVKAVSGTYSTRPWQVYHRGLDATSPEEKYLVLNTTAAVGNAANFWNNTAPTSTEFTLGTWTGGNGTGTTYVAYLFAHHNDDGGFGINGDQDIIKCGSFTSSTGTGTAVDLGFEPQWVLTKRYDGTENWKIHDNIRGIRANLTDNMLKADTNQAEDTGAENLTLTPNGFRGIGSAGRDYVYIAIRRGPMAVPTTATDLFSIDTSGATSPTPPRYTSGFPVDMALRKTVNTSSNWELLTRAMYGTSLRPNHTNAEDTGSGADRFDYMDGYNYQTTINSNQYSWMWRRAPKYFDTVNYIGTGSSLTIDHNLGVEPDMIWLKDRDGSNPWIVQGKVVSPSNNSRLELNDSMQLTSLTTGVTALTSTSFTLGTFNNINVANTEYVAYLFASLDGISKVGTFTGDNTNDRVIDCGFSSSARFVIVKGTNRSGTQWFVFDSERGITTGNDSVVLLNETNTQQSLNLVEPASSGFAVNYYETENFNKTGDTYVFYAIA